MLYSVYAKNRMYGLDFTTEEIWTAGETSLGNSTFWFLIMELKSRRILVYAIKGKHITGNSELECVISGVDQLTAYGKRLWPNFIHVDRDSVYNDLEFRDGLKQLGITLSQTTPKKHGNQSIESYHHQVKIYLVLFFIEILKIEPDKSNYLEKTLTKDQLKLFDRSQLTLTWGSVFLTTIYLKNIAMILLREVF